MRFPSDHLRATLALTTIGLALSSGAVAASAPAATPMKVTEHVTLKLVKRTGSTKFEHSGRAVGTVAGSVRSVSVLSHSILLRGTVTISTARGKLKLKIDGRARSLSLRTKFEGTASIVGGSGRYAHAHGSGRFSGIVNRSTWAATIDATGSFTY